MPLNAGSGARLCQQPWRPAELRCGVSAMSRVRAGSRRDAVRAAGWRWGALWLSGSSEPLGAALSRRVHLRSGSGCCAALQVKLLASASASVL